MKTFTWEREEDHRASSGIRWVLRTTDFPEHHFSPLCKDDRVGVCGYNGKRRWEANFWTGYTSINAFGGTAGSAIRRLQAELDRRSIGLFEDDDVKFVGGPA